MRTTRETLPAVGVTLLDYLVAQGGEVIKSKAEIQAETGLDALELMLAEAYLSDANLARAFMLRKGGSGKRGRVLRVL